MKTLRPWLVSIGIHLMIALTLMWPYFRQSRRVNVGSEKKSWFEVGTFGLRSKFSSRNEKPENHSQEAISNHDAPPGKDSGIGNSPRTLQSSDPLFSQIQNQIRSHLNYPVALQRKRVSGEVQVELAISKDGNLKEVQVERTSGDSRLDQLALDAVRAAQPYPHEELKLSLPIRFKLNL